ncbi:hypothetical protein J6590_033734 [Homalodisca vitripennis]|nr:hypothetical protein J6590_033734 [Homalodisca vitripennis]
MGNSYDGVRPPLLLVVLPQRQRSGLHNMLETISSTRYFPRPNVFFDRVLSSSRYSPQPGISSSRYSIIRVFSTTRFVLNQVSPRLGILLYQMSLRQGILLDQVFSSTRCLFDKVFSSTRYSPLPDVSSTMYSPRPGILPNQFSGFDVSLGEIFARSGQNLGSARWPGSAQINYVGCVTVEGRSGRRALWRWGAHSLSVKIRKQDLLLCDVLDRMPECKRLQQKRRLAERMPPLCRISGAIVANKICYFARYWTECRSARDCSRRDGWLNVCRRSAALAAR